MSEPDHPQDVTRGRRAPSRTRERILDVAYELFSRRGIRAVGVDTVIARAGIAKATLYRYFPSKDHLVLAFLELRERRFVHDFVEAEMRRRGSTPEEQLLAIFDAYDEWFRLEDFEACSFVNVLLEEGAKSSVGEASIRHLEKLRALTRGLAEQADLHDVEAFSRSWHILMKGSIVAAVEGDLEAARRAKVMAERLIDEHREAGAARRRTSGRAPGWAGGPPSQRAPRPSAVL